MKTISVISQKGGSGKTTLAVHLAVAAQKKGLQTAIFDLDPQASASTWADHRTRETPVVIQAKASLLPVLLEQASAQKAGLVIIDSAPHADSAALTAARLSDLILIPCRPSAFDLRAIGSTLSMVSQKPAYVVLNAVPSHGKVGEEARKALISGGVHVATPFLHHLVAFSHAVNDGRAAQELDPRSKASCEIEDLLDWVMDVTKISKHMKGFS